MYIRAVYASICVPVYMYQYAKRHNSFNPSVLHKTPTPLKCIRNAELARTARILSFWILSKLCYLMESPIYYWSCYMKQYEIGDKNPALKIIFLPVMMFIITLTLSFQLSLTQYLVNSLAVQFSNITNMYKIMYTACALDVKKLA